MGRSGDKVFIQYNYRLMSLYQHITCSTDRIGNQVARTFISGNAKRILARAGSVQRRLLLLLLFGTGILIQSTKEVGAQSRILRGTVHSSADNQPLTGVTVKVKGTSNGSTTDTDGVFELANVTSSDTLLVSSIGYDQKQVAVGDRSVIKIVLSMSVSALDQLVVIGYGKERKSSLTSSIATIKNDKLDQIPVGRLESALVGRLAGVHITTPESVPGSAPIIRIRGTGSISAGNSPLVVIDGFPGGSLSDIDMNDVESIEVLKDASAAAIYGSRGSGGVIIVTTKNGSNGKPVFNFNAYYGISKAMGHKDWMTGEEYYRYQVKYKNRDFYNAGGDTSLPIWGDARRPATYQVNPVIKEGNTNWEDEVLQSAPIQSYSLSIAGGKDNVQYYLSGSLKNEKGTLINTWYKTYAARARLHIDINSFLSAGLTLSPHFSKRRLPGAGIHALAKAGPYVSPIQNKDGSWPRALDYWGTSVSAQVSPFAVLYGTHNYSSSFNNLGQLYLEAKLMEGLTFKTSLDVNFDVGKSEAFRAPYATSNGVSSGSAGNSRTTNIINENLLTYNRTFHENHNLNVILGGSYQKSSYYNASMSAINGTFNNDIIFTLNNAQVSPESGTSKTQWGLISYFGRVNYNYQEKYFVSGSFRMDGSSRFGSENRWGSFPAISAAWRISQEPFFEGVKAVNEFKVRASYGLVGNFNIGNFQYLGRIGQAYYSPGDEPTTSMAQTSLGNPELHWEKTHSLDIGMDVGLLDDRISLTVDYYRKRTSGLLYDVDIPATTGFSNSLVNVGNIENKGVEISIKTQNLTGAFRWSTGFNLSHNENKVISLEKNLNEVIHTHSRGMSWLLRVGEPMFSYYGYKLVGVLENESDVEKYPTLPGSQPGNGRFEDVNGDGEITPEDKVILGNFQPDFVLGMVNNFSWKGFDLSIALQSSLGAEMYELENLYYEGPTVCAMRRSLVDHQWWSSSDPGDGMSPSTSLGELAYVSNSDYYIENASYLMVRNINLGYTFPQHWTRRFKVNDLRVFISASNLLMVTDKAFHGYNPEGFTSGGIDGINSMPGYNVGAFPLSRTIAIGLNLQF